MRSADKAPREELDRALVDGMAQSLKEAHTYFMPPEIFSQQMAELQNRNRYAGVGIQMSQDLIITDVFEGSPAEGAGLLPGDQLIAVNGESIEGMTSAETSTRVRGEPGTPVTLTLRRVGVAEPVVKTITRATISIRLDAGKNSGQRHRLPPDSPVRRSRIRCRYSTRRWIASPRRTSAR